MESRVRISSGGKRTLRHGLGDRIRELLDGHKPMTTTDELLRADSTNVPIALDLLRSFDPATSTVFETADGLFAAFNRCAAESYSHQDAADDERLAALANGLSLSRDELIERIRSDESLSPIDEARTTWNAMGARYSKKIVLLLLSRYFRWGVADLLRLRITPVLGYGRLQAEACALLRLFVDNPRRAEEWQRTSQTEGGGRRFFNETRGSLRTIMDRYRLSNFYERGSASSQHVRMGSAVSGLSITDEGMQLRDQEVDPGNPGTYIRKALWFLSVQVTIFMNLLDAVPDVQCGEWQDRRRVFADDWARLWRLLEQRYPLDAEDPGDELGAEGTADIPAST